MPDIYTKSIYDAKVSNSRQNVFFFYFQFAISIDSTIFGNDAV